MIAQVEIILILLNLIGTATSVADPDPYVFGLPNLGSFFHQAKIVGKTLIPTVLSLIYDFLSFKK